MCVHNAVLEGEITFAEPQLITHYCSVISMKGSSMLKIKMYLLHPPGVLAFIQHAEDIFSHYQGESCRKTPVTLSEGR